MYVLLAFVGFVAIGVGAIWLFVNLIRKRNKKTPAITIVVGFVLFVAGLLMAPNNTSTKDNNTQQTSTEQVKEQQPVATHDVQKEKDAILKSLQGINTPISNPTVEQDQDGVYEVFVDMNITSTDETTARQESVKAIQAIIQANQNKGYDIESVSVTPMNNKAPIGIYTYIGAKYSQSGADEYSVIANGKVSKFEP